MFSLKNIVLFLTINCCTIVEAKRVPIINPYSPRTCTEALSKINFIRAFTNLEVAFSAQNDQLKKALSKEGKGWFILDNPYWVKEVGQIIYSSMPKTTQYHLDRGYFMLKEGLISSQTVNIPFDYYGLPRYRDFDIGLEGVQIIQSITMLVLNKLQSALGSQELLQVYNIGFLHHYEGSKDQQVDPLVYMPHVDKAHDVLYTGANYIRILIPVYGPGTYYWEDFPGERKQVNAGDVIIMEGEDRQHSYGIERKLLWHQMPNLINTGLGRTAISIDVVSRDPISKPKVKFRH